MADADKKTKQANPEEVDLAAQMDSLLSEINQVVPDLGVQVSGVKAKSVVPDTAAKAAAATAPAGGVADDQLGVQLSRLLEEAKIGDARNAEALNQEAGKQSPQEIVSQAAGEQPKDLADVTQNEADEQSRAKGGVLKPAETAASAEAISAGGFAHEDDVEASLVSDAISLATQLQELLTEVKTQGLTGDTPPELAGVLSAEQGPKVDHLGPRAIAETAAEPAASGEVAGLVGAPSGQEAGKNIQAADQVAASGVATEVAAASSALTAASPMPTQKEAGAGVAQAVQAAAAPITAPASLSAGVLAGASDPLPDEPKTMAELDAVLVKNSEGMEDDEAEHTEALMKMLAAKRQALTAGLTGSGAAAGVEDKVAQPIQAAGTQPATAAGGAAEAAPAMPDLAAVIADAAAGVAAAAKEPAGAGSGAPRSIGGATAADVARELDSQPELKSAGGAGAVAATLAAPASSVPAQQAAQPVSPPAAIKPAAAPAPVADTLAIGNVKPAADVAAAAGAAGAGSSAVQPVSQSAIKKAGPALKAAFGKLKPKPGGLKKACRTPVVVAGRIACRILWLTNKPLARLTPLTRNAIGYVGLVTLFNGALLVIGKLVSMKTGGH